MSSKSEIFGLQLVVAFEKKKKKKKSAHQLGQQLGRIELH